MTKAKGDNSQEDKQEFVPALTFGPALLGKQAWT